MRYFILSWCMALSIQGCSVLNSYPDASMAAEDRMCQGWLENIEAVLKASDIWDPATARIEGEQQLRVNRFLAAMADKATANDAAFADWLEDMRRLDATEKELGFANLPDSVKGELVLQSPGPGSFSQVLQDCGKRLNRFGFNDPKRKSRLLTAAQVPDAYQDWKRVIGLYPLASVVAAFGLERLHRELSVSFEIPLAKLPTRGEPISYAPAFTDSLSSADIAAMLRSAYDNPLGVPRLNPERLRQLLARFAPVWEIDTRNETDRIGAVFFDNDGRPQVDVSQPAVYTGQAYALWRGEVVLQLIYQIWLPAREKTGPLDLYGGLLDSVIWRVTLSPQGEPIAYDSIHGCGCYYLLFPGEKYRAVPPKDGAEPVLSPKSIPSIPTGGRILLRLESRTHYLQQAELFDETLLARTLKYNFLGLDAPRSLSGADGDRQSLYGEDGIIDASERAERFLLWPFGVASPGAMRQWGVHAIAFVGKRHFDDPFLLENLMEEK